jgi:outer membrane protein assembly factor BamB
VHRLEATTGAEEWTHTTGCTSGGGRTPVVHDGKVWVRDHPTDPSLVLSAATGHEEGTFFASPAPAFHGDLAFLGFLGGNGRTLESVDADTGEVFWSTTGDGQFTTAPLSVGNRVYMGSGSGWVFAFDEATGQQLWAANAGHSVDSPDEHNVSEPLVGLASGDGLLLVPAGNDLVAYG